MMRSPRIGGLIYALCLLLFTICLTVIPAYETYAESDSVRQFQTSHFTFIYHTQEEKSLEPLFQEAEEVLEKIRGHLPPFPPRVIQVKIASNNREFIKFQSAPRSPAWALAIAYPRQGLILMKAPRMITQGHPDLVQTFRHELTHILLGEAFGERPVPSWLQEGMAQLMENAWDLHRISIMTRAVLADEVIPLWDLDVSFPVDLHKAEVAYAESYYFLSFLLNRYGRQTLQNFILELSQGVDMDLALSRATGSRLREIIQLWEQYIRLRFNWIPIITGGGALWFAAAFVLIMGYMLKRHRARRLLREWEMEEAMPTNLTLVENLNQEKKTLTNSVSSDT
jgi:hypothetical protein